MSNRDIGPLQHVSPSIGPITPPAITTQDRTLSAKAHIQVTGTLKTLSSKAHIQVTGAPQTITSLAHISVTGKPRTLSAKAHIQVTATTKTLSSLAHVQVTGLKKSISSLANIKLTHLKNTISATANIVVEGKAQTISALAHIKFVGTRTLPALAHISVTGKTKTLSAKAHIAKQSVKWIVGAYVVTSANFANRVKMLGAYATDGSGTELVSIVDNTVSQAALGRVVEVIVVNRQITDADTLALAAQVELDNRGAQIRLTFDFEHDGIEVGDLVLIQSGGAAINASFVVQQLNVIQVSPTRTRYTAQVGNWQNDLRTRLKLLAAQAPATLIPPVPPPPASVTAAMIASVDGTSIVSNTIDEDSIISLPVSKLTSGTASFAATTTFEMTTGGAGLVLDTGSVLLAGPSGGGSVTCDGSEVTIGPKLTVGEVDCSALKIGGVAIVPGGSFTFLDGDGVTVHTVSNGIVVS